MVVVPTSHMHQNSWRWLLCC